MKKHILLFSLFFTFFACENEQKELQRTAMDDWKTNWRMIYAAYFDGKPEVGAQHFDTLLASNNPVKTDYVVTGLGILDQLGRTEKIDSILQTLDKKALQQIRNDGLFPEKLEEYEIYEATTENTEVQNPDLEREIIRLYINDQYVRGKMMEKVMAEYNISKDDLPTEDGTTVDANNRERLKEIIAEYGFPRKELIGKKAMRGVFLIIQHADRDKEWQKSQFPNIEKAVKRGDLDGENYALLYDRIQTNSGENQLYGTQVQKIDRENTIVELKATEDIEKLNQRRMEMGMMPIELYKKLMLKEM